MFIHYHSLYVGIIVFAILFPLGSPFMTGLVGIAACLGTDYQQLKLRLKKNDQPGAYAVASLLQALALFLGYIILHAAFFGRFF